MILISILFLLYLLLAFFPFLDYLRLDLKKCKPLFIPNENSEPKLSRYMEEAEVVDSLEAGCGQIFDRFLGVRATANFASSCQLESCYASTITLGTECIVSGLSLIHI